MRKSTMCFVPSGDPEKILATRWSVCPFSPYSNNTSWFAYLSEDLVRDGRDADVYAEIEKETVDSKDTYTIYYFHEKKSTGSSTDIGTEDSLEKSVAKVYEYLQKEHPPEG